MRTPETEGPIRARETSPAACASAGDESGKLSLVLLASVATTTAAKDGFDNARIEDPTPD